MNINFSIIAPLEKRIRKKSEKNAAISARALEAAEVVTVRSVVALEVMVDYGLYERADLLIRAAGGKLAEPEFTDRVTLRWQMPEHTEGPLLTQLQELTRGTANVTVSAPFYAAF